MLRLIYPGQYDDSLPKSCTAQDVPEPVDFRNMWIFKIVRGCVSAKFGPEAAAISAMRSSQALLRLAGGRRLRCTKHELKTNQAPCDLECEKTNGRFVALPIFFENQV